jgi:gliding motility-associated-like protein
MLSPGSIIASVTELPVSCDNIELKAGMEIRIDLNATDVSGPYETVVMPAEDPFEQFVYSIPDNGIRTIMGLDKGIYDVEVRSVSGSGCTYEEEIRLNSGPYPVDFQIVRYDSIVPCLGSSASIQIGNVRGDPANGFVLELRRGDNSLVSAYNLTYSELAYGFTFQDLQPGLYVIHLRQDQAGCPDIVVISDVLRISEPPGELGFEVLDSGASYPDLPTGFIAGNVLPSGGNPYQAIVQLNESYSLELTVIDILEFNEGQSWRLVTRFGDNFSYYPVKFDSLWPGVYEITVRDAFGCEVSLYYEVPLDSTLFIPNVFTPNGDGYNDAFYIRNLPKSGTKVLITNRWGKTVFKSDDYNRDTLWDGGEEGDGVYFYYLTLPGGKSHKGWLELWRGGMP